jgi:DNA-binding beta-propeller fold protein YncE
MEAAMERFNLTVGATLALLFLSNCSSTPAGDIKDIKLKATIQVPSNPVANPTGKLSAFDVSYLDSSKRRFYLSDRINAGIEVVDTERNVHLYRIEGFAGDVTKIVDGKAQPDHDHAGPNGVLVIEATQELWAGDGDSTVKVVDLATKKIVDKVSTGGTARADEMSFDPDDKIVLAVNNAEEIADDDPQSGPFATLISTQAGHKVLGKIVFHRATAGLEQSVWDPATKRFYLAVPELDGDAATGAVAVIDPRSATVVNLFPIKECQGAGVALGPNGHLLIGCSGDAIEEGFESKSIIMNVGDGSIAATIDEVGGSDEVWFNAGDNRYYLAARDNPDGPVLGVIDAMSNAWITNVATSKDAKSVAADAVSNHVFVPLTPTSESFANDAMVGLNCASGCIGVYAP